MEYETLYILAVIIYIIVTVIMWRNISMPLFYKALFCLFVVPVFAFGMWFNLWLFELVFPELYVVHDNATSGKYGDKGVYAFVLSMPLALLMSFGWYLFLKSYNSVASDTD